MTGFAVSVAPRLASRAGVCGRELAVLAFAGGVTYFATQYITVTWSPAPCERPGVGVLVAGAAVLAAAARRRVPVLALLAAALLVGWYPAAGVTLALTAYGVAARTRSLRWRCGALAVAAATPFAVGLAGSDFQWQTALADYGVVAVVCVLGPVVVQVLLAQRERLLVALRQQTRFAASAARLQERSRIAQEMHDLLGHRLSLISLYAGSLELDAAQPAETTEPARLIRGTVQTAMDELRATLGILRQGEAGLTRPADRTGTRSDVQELVRQARTAGVEIDLAWRGPDLTDTAPPTRQAVHRIVREGLTNACRHAAGARAEVVVERGPDRIRVSVTDDGRGGVAPAGSDPGLAGVPDRSRGSGGSNAPDSRRGLTGVPDRIRHSSSDTSPADSGPDLTGAPDPIRRSGTGSPGIGPVLTGIANRIRRSSSGTGSPDSGPVLTAIPDRIRRSETGSPGSGRGLAGVTGEGRGDTNPPASGLGLVGVEERVRLLGGTFRAGPVPGGGFRITAELPAAITTPAPAPGTDAQPDDRWARLGMSVVLATGLAGVAAIVVFVFGMVPFDGVGDPFGSLGLGSPRARVADLAGEDDPVARRAARGAEPPAPTGSDCSYSLTFTEDGTSMIERYCFRSDLLVDKARFTLPRA